MKKSRIEWIDALKGFGIICVTLGHLSPWLPLETHIYSFHMCLFFFISGYLYINNKYNTKEFIIKITKSLLIPFFIWNILSSLISIIFVKDLSEIFSNFFMINGKTCWNTPIWFLIILFFTELIYYFFNKIFKEKKPTLIFMFLCAILWVKVGSTQLFAKINLLPLSLLFYSLGNIFKQISNNKFFAKTYYVIPGIVVLGIINIFFGVIKNERISYAGASFGNIYYCIIAAMSGVIFYFLIFKKVILLSKSKILCVLGKNSLIIMVLQYWFFKLIYDVISQKYYGFSIWHERNSLKAILLTIVTIIGIMAIDRGVKCILKNNKKAINGAKYFGIKE